VKLLNKTCYSTRDLRKLVLRIAKGELNPEKIKRATIRFIPWRSNWTGGCAHIGGDVATIKMPNPDKHKLDMPAVAKTIAHEMAHMRGLKHGPDMHCGRYSWKHGDYRTFYAWANEYQIGVNRQKSKPEPTPVAKTDAKLEHAKKMLVKNEAKLKRTQALVKKWTAKVKYYEKRVEAVSYEGKRTALMAAASKEPKIFVAESLTN
jgi:hypothetical protein